jgi:hypothetical protein
MPRRFSSSLATSAVAEALGGMVQVDLQRNQPAAALKRVKMK